MGEEERTCLSESYLNGDEYTLWSGNDPVCSIGEGMYREILCYQVWPLKLHGITLHFCILIIHIYILIIISF